jgi:hypothetical protein
MASCPQLQSIPFQLSFLMFSFCLVVDVGIRAPFPSEAMMPPVWPRHIMVHARHEIRLPTSPLDDACSVSAQQNKRYNVNVPQR